VKAQWADTVSRDQAKLLGLTHDSIFSRGMDHAITFWNRGSEELFGWTRDEALGKVSHQLLQMSFPVPLDQIMTELLRAGRWEGTQNAQTRSSTMFARWSRRRRRANPR